MAKPRATKIEQPGDPLPDKQIEPASDAPVAAESAVPAARPVPAQEGDEPVSDKLTPAQEKQLKADLAKTAKLVGANDALDWSDLNPGLPAATGKIDPDAHLPASADPKTITAPVLTKGGWVLPENDARVRGPR